MEQSWSDDRYDIPSGDWVFWAQRRGAIGGATRHGMEVSSTGTASHQRRTALARALRLGVWLSVLTPAILLVVRLTGG